VARITDLSQRYTRPDWVRRLNAMGDSVGGAERLVPIDGERLVDSARASTGLSDFGDFDGDWRGRFDSLVSSIEDDARLHVVGRLMTRQELLRGLRTRLLLSEARRQRPAIADERIEAPIAISGPARSGTSILFELLSLDPNGRGPLATESNHPVPPAELEPSALLGMTECEQELWTDVQPELAAVHEMRSDLPVECITLQVPSFAGFHWPMVARVPGFALDLAKAMDYHRAVLQTLQHDAPADLAGRTWVLKTPIYLMAIDLLFATYPDAWLIHTHRDPLKTLPSGISTATLIRWLRSDHVDPDEYGGAYGTLALLLGVIERRKAGDLEPRIIDSHFSDLMGSPVAAIEKIYDRMGRPFLGEHADAIRAYLANKPKGKFGHHRYSLEEWGIDPREARERSRAYTEHYGVELED
jgi:hypothetical protein